MKKIEKVKRMAVELNKTILKLISIFVLMFKKFLNC